MKSIFAIAISMFLAACASPGSKPVEPGSVVNNTTNKTDRKPARSFFASYECFPQNNADSKILDTNTLRLRIDMTQDEFRMKERIYDSNTLKLNDTLISCKNGSTNEDGSAPYCDSPEQDQSRFPFEVSGKKGYLDLNIGKGTELIDDVPNKPTTVIYLGKLVSGSVTEVVVCHLVGE